MAEEEDFWRQKSKEKWLAEGDRNTKFFHSSVAEKRSRLLISRIRDANGSWLSDDGLMRQEAVKFFQDLLSADGSVSDQGTMDEFLDYIPTLLTASDNVFLLRPITLEEVHQAVFRLDPDSSPGPDGFPGKFYQVFWDDIAPDLHAAVQEFFIGVPVPKSISSALIVLLPKK